MLELVHELKSRDINIRAMVPGPAESPLNLELRKAGASTAIYRPPASLAIQSARSRARATRGVRGTGCYPAPNSP